MKKVRNWAIAVFVVSATAGIFALQNQPASLPATTGEPSFATGHVEVGITATASLAYEGCAFIWATHDAPGLTAILDETVRELNPDADATASFFGEDCVYADGHSTFGAMETDVFIHLPVSDLTDDEYFGNWIAQVMEAVIEVPKEEFQGRYGFVEFWFNASDTEHLVVRVPIDKYLAEGQGLSGAELLQFFIETP